MAKVIKTKKEFEGHWFEEFVRVEGEGLSAWGPEAQLTCVGQGQTRIDGAERVKGRACFTADVHLPGMLYGKMLRSPHPHARIKKIDSQRAEQVPGVRAVLTFQNIPKIPFYGGQTYLLDETVRYVGEEVACIIAEDEEICEDGLERMDVNYDLLPFVIDPEAALEAGAPQVQADGNLFRGEPEIYQRGDIQGGFGAADVIVEEVYRTQTALHNCMETHGSVAFWEGEHLTLWDSTQHVFGVRADVAKLLEMPLDRVRVIKKYMGGGFGSKNRAGRYTLLAALGARVTGRPVKIMLDRHEENLTAGNRPSSIQTLKMGARQDGTLTAIYLRIISGAGAYTVWPAAVGGPARQLYACPNVRTEQYNVFTNTGPMSSFRAPGYVEGTFALESAMEELAKNLGMDPLDLRMKNYIERDQVTGRPYSSKALREAYQRGAEKIRWSERANVRKGRKRRGWGMASQIWSGGGGPPAYAEIRINPDGTAVILSGTQDIGTGTKTVLAQIAAEELGFNVEQITMEIGDTQTGPYAPLSAGSMTLSSVGPAVRIAAYSAREQLLDVASQVLETERESLSLKGGLFHRLADQEPVSVERVLMRLGSSMIVGQGARAPNSEVVNLNTFGAQFAQVDIDAETGEITVNKIIAVHDFGKVINPLTSSSQIEGGILQGLGFSLIEERIVDRATGAVVNGDLENYKVPTYNTMPEIVVEMIDRADAHANNLGGKGLGEPPIIPTAAAVANAVSDALGIRIKELPISRDKVLKLISDVSPQISGKNHLNPS